VEAITDLLKLDYFSSNPCDRPIQQKNRVIAVSLAMAAIVSANASKMAEYFSF
jgi:hypothetical protein